MDLDGFRWIWMDLDGLGGFRCLLKPMCKVSQGEPNVSQGEPNVREREPNVRGGEPSVNGRNGR